MSAGQPKQQYDVATAKTDIDNFFRKYAQAGGATMKSFAAVKSSGKVYEAWVLTKVVEGLESEGYTATLQGPSGTVQLHSTPGPIKSGYAYFELDHATEPALEIWTDIEFLTLSHDDRKPQQPSRGDYHELDVLVVPAGAKDRPPHGDIVIGVECKATPYTKGLLRAILGVRRELSLLQSPQATRFAKWPRSTVPADPASCLLTYCTDKKIKQLDSAGDTFGIDFIHDGGP